MTSAAGCSCGSVCLCPAARFSPASPSSRWFPAVDRGRDIQARLGFRVYRVELVHVRWTGAKRGDGVEEVVTRREILPAPAVQDLGGVTRTLSVAQVDEVGTVMIDKISAAYTEAQVLCRPATGRPLPPNEAIYYEIEHVNGGERRRLSPVGGSAPNFKAAGGWSVVATLQRPARR